MPGAPPAVICAICGRSLLVGERASRFSQDGVTYVEVCPLCRERALELGWYREGAPTVPVRPTVRRRSLFQRIFHGPDHELVSPVDGEPRLERLSDHDRLVVGAAAYFNHSDHRRTIGGLIRSLGMPRASVVPLSGITGEVVITVFWDISWYQYRVVPDASQPVQLAERGYESDELQASFTEWNAAVDETGAIAPLVSADEGPTISA